MSASFKLAIAIFASSLMVPQSQIASTQWKE
jgi:hypothetical protein